MSRVGKKPIASPQGVNVDYQERQVHLKGPKGEHNFSVPQPVDLKIEDGLIQVEADYVNDTTARRMMGTVQSVLQNMVTGVAEGFTKKLQLVGVGYRASVQGKNIELLLGFSKPVNVTLPETVSAEMEGNTQIILSCHDNVLLGQVAAKIRAYRPPEPYQGKGILYENERIRRKAGKAGKK
ncbi:MAG: 50S ribosomal protein L6 [SAR324 cluster bacterium]|nr:50S ribosomal protein L6 [SAR324 cluster bacterium]